MPSRAPWHGGEVVSIVAPESVIKQHPEYTAAKGGDAHAAARLAMGVMDDAWFDLSQADLIRSNPILVGVHAVEGLSVNRIGAMMAQWVSFKHGSRPGQTW